MEGEQESDMSAMAAELVLERGMSRFILFYLTFVVWKPTNACTFFGLVHDFGNSVVSRQLMVNPPISTVGLGYTAFDLPSQ